MDAFHRLEAPGIRRFVPRPRTLGQPLCEVNPPEDVAVRDHAVVIGKIVRRDALAVGDEAMVRVVKEQHEAVTPTGCAERADQLRRIPLVRDHEIRIAEEAVERDGVGIVADAFQPRVRRAKFPQRRLPVLFSEILKAPAVRWFVDDDVVAPRDEL